MHLLLLARPPVSLLSEVLKMDCGQSGGCHQLNLESIPLVQRVEVPGI